MSKGSQLTTNQHTQFVLKVTEGTMFRKEFIITVADVLKQAGKIRTGKRKKPMDQPQGVGCIMTVLNLSGLSLFNHQKNQKKLCTTQLPKNVNHRH